MLKSRFKTVKNEEKVSRNWEKKLCENRQKYRKTVKNVEKTLIRRQK